MQKKIVVAHIGTGIPDSVGDILAPGAINYAEVMLRRNFDGMPIGRARIEEKGNEVVATCELLPDIKDEFKGLYPAIGFKVNKATLNPDGIRELNDITIMEVSLCNTRNVDPTIKPIE